jgi:flagellar basal-body rod protein FlgC
MSMFSAITTSGTGLDVDQTWIDTIGGNVANAEDAVTPGQAVYRDQEVVAEASPSSAVPGSSNAGTGVHVEGIELGSAQGILTYDPSNPLANKQGEVTFPDVNIGSQMSSLVEAQVSYEANANVLQSSDAAYKSMLAIKP